MKTYSISKVSKEMNLTVYTLRYYDKKGLMPFVERTPVTQEYSNTLISMHLE